MLRPFSRPLLARPLLALALLSLTVTPASFVSTATASLDDRGRQEQPRAATSFSDTDDLSARLAAVEKAVEEKRRESNVPGLSLAIVKDDRVVLVKGFGFKDVERKLPVTADTLFAIGSASKAFTAMAAVISADEGKLSLDDSPKKFLPYFKLKDPDTDQKVTIRDLLSHRAGLMHHNDIAWAVGTLNREEVIRVAGGARPAAKLGEKFQYNNIMYSAAGEAVARAYSSTWEAVIADRILKPLGMKATGASVKDMQRAPDFSLGYEREGDSKKTKRVAMRDLTPIAPAGAINSNAKEMAAWLRLMLGGGVFEGKRLVSEKGFNEIVSVQMRIAEKVGYGLGWVLMEWQGHKTIWHNGGIDGFHSLVEMMPDRRLGFVILSNISDSPLESDFRKIIWSNLVGNPQQAAAAGSPGPSGSNLKEVIGNFESEKDQTPVEVLEKDGKYLLIVPGQPPYPLAEKEKDVLSVGDLPDSYRVIVKRDPANKVSGIVLKQPEGEFVFNRPAGFVAPISVDELMTKVIDAAGGQPNWRKHKSMLMTASLDFEHQGVTGEAVIKTRAPDSYSQSLMMMALGKKIGWVYEFFDGAQGGAHSSFSPSESKTSQQVDEAKITYDFYQLLNWRKLFKNVEIKKMDKVGGEGVYVVVKTPEKGSPVTDYVSTKSFLVLRRDKIETGGSGQPQPITETYGEYRQVEGCVIAFKVVQNTPSLGEVVVRVKEIKFDVAVEDSAFRAPAASR